MKAKTKTRTSIERLQAANDRDVARGTQGAPSKPTLEPIAPEVAAAVHDSALAVHKRTGSTKLARRAGLLWAAAVAADLAAGLPARPRFAIGGEPTVEGARRSTGCWLRWGGTQRTPTRPILTYILSRDRLSKNPAYMLKYRPTNSENALHKSQARCNLR